MSLHTMNPFVLVVFVSLAGLLAPGEASAQVRKCLLPPAETGRVCDEATCIALQTTINNLCKAAGTAPISCDRVNGCAALQAMLGKWQVCLAAREAIRETCFPPPAFDPGHQRSVQQTIDSINKCVAKMQLPPPIGCGPDCSF